MSILIKGMTLDEFTSLDGNIGDFVNDEQLDVVEVPEPHGRLIDADELFLEFQTDEQMRLGENLQYVRKTIEDAPTVIEAEE